jgi:F0F1-type ATP synthase assembly protein I
VDPKRSREERSRARQVGILTAIPAALLAGPLIGGLFGNFLDSHLGTGPWGLLVFLALGFAASGIEVKRLLQLANQDEAPPAPPRSANTHSDTVDRDTRREHTD